MRYLLDTHILLWWLLDTDDLSPGVKDLIDTETEVYVSAATIWEVAIKHSLGKLDVPTNFDTYVSRAGLTELPVQGCHGIEAAHLPLHHRDPFDRMLIAQARLDRLTLITHDETIRRYDVAIHQE